MRPHGRARISARAPEALGICQRCGFMYNLSDLAWQFDWLQGPRLFNLRLKVCPSCLDVPQENGRTIVLPPDPVPVELALPETYVLADNPLSYLGYNPANLNGMPLTPQTVSIGTLTQNAGINAAFDSATNKRAPFSAGLAISVSSFGNWVGKNWDGDTTGIVATTPSTVPVNTHVLSSFALYAPSDAPFLRSASQVTGYRIDGSSDASTWTTLASGNTVGGLGEIITGASTVTTAYQYHRAVLQGDGISAVAIAQAIFNVSDQAPNDI